MKFNSEDEFYDRFDRFAFFNTQMVYDMSKSIPMAMGEYIELSRKLGRWATKEDVTTPKSHEITDDDKRIEAAVNRVLNRNAKAPLIVSIICASIVLILAGISIIR